MADKPETGKKRRPLVTAQEWKKRLQHAQKSQPLNNKSLNNRTEEELPTHETTQETSSLKQGYSASEENPAFEQESTQDRTSNHSIPQDHKRIIIPDSESSSVSLSSQSEENASLHDETLFSKEKPLEIPKEYLHELKAASFSNFTQGKRPPLQIPPSPTKKKRRMPRLRIFLLLFILGGGLIYGGLKYSKNLAKFSKNPILIKAKDTPEKSIATTVGGEIITNQDFLVLDPQESSAPKRKSILQTEDVPFEFEEVPPQQKETELEKQPSQPVVSKPLDKRFSKEKSETQTPSNTTVENQETGTSQTVESLSLSQEENQQNLPKKDSPKNKSQTKRFSKNIAKTTAGQHFFIKLGESNTLDLAQDKATQIWVEQQELMQSLSPFISKNKAGKYQILFGLLKTEISAHKACSNFEEANFRCSVQKQIIP